MTESRPAPNQPEGAAPQEPLLCPTRFGQWLNAERERLLRLIEPRVGAKLRRKVELEDLLQDASARAVATLGRQTVFASDPLSWFLCILDHQILDAHRFHFGAQKRDASREVSGDAPAGGGLGDESPALIGLLVASITSPSQAFSRNVRLGRMQEAVAALPEDAETLSAGGTLMASQVSKSRSACKRPTELCVCY